MIPQVFIPEHAPFDAVQRAWLNGFLAGLAGAPTPAKPAGGDANYFTAPPISAPTATASAAPVPEAEPAHGPWHDPTLSLPERMKLAEGKPLPLLLSAAMGQLDCGQCGYLCDTYAKALSEGAEKDVGLCVPGGKPTKDTIKKLLADKPAAPASPSMAATA